MTTFTMPVTDRALREMTAAERAMTSQQDLRGLIASSKRWLRVWVAAGVGIVFAAIVLVSIQLSTGALGELPIGSLVLLAMILYQTGEIVSGSLIMIPVARLEASCAFRTYWRSPVDSPWIQESDEGQKKSEFIRGLAVTGLLVPVLILLLPGSDVLVPAAVAVVSAGYVAILVSAIGTRIFLQRIVKEAKAARMEAIQRRIDAFDPLLLELTEQEFTELERLAKVSDMIRDSPTRLRMMGTVTRVLGSVIIPTIGFVVTVILNQYAGQAFEKVLP